MARKELDDVAAMARDPQLRRDAERLPSPAIGRGRGRIPRYRALEVITALSRSAPWSAAARKAWRRERRPVPAEPRMRFSL
jgi:hypothetical protein